MRIWIIYCFCFVLQASNILAAKKSTIIQQTNDENALPVHYTASVATVKQDAKIPVDQFKAFTVFEEEQSAVDENVPPMKSVSDEVVCSAMSTSYTSVRYLSTMMIFPFVCRSLESISFVFIIQLEIECIETFRTDFQLAHRCSINIRSIIK